MLSPQDGTTALIAAAKSGHAAMVQLLLKLKANPSKSDQVSAQNIYTTLSIPKTSKSHSADLLS